MICGPLTSWVAPVHRPIMAAIPALGKGPETRRHPGAGPGPLGNVARVTDADVPTRIDLYWRPGCGFCIMLRRRLDKLGVQRVEHNIWDDPAAAEVVRHHANGNETVPTVVVGSTGLVNPSADQVLALVEAEAPHLLPDELPDSGPGLVGRLFARARS